MECEMPENYQEWNPESKECNLKSNLWHPKSKEWNLMWDTESKEQNPEFNGLGVDQKSQGIDQKVKKLTSESKRWILVSSKQTLESSES